MVHSHDGYFLMQRTDVRWISKTLTIQGSQCKTENIFDQKAFTSDEMADLLMHSYRVESGVF